MISKSFDFQCEFDFQITTSKMILILNNLYLGYLILILKSSTYDDFAHLCRYGIQQMKSVALHATNWRDLDSHMSVLTPPPVYIQQWKQACVNYLVMDDKKKLSQS